MSSRTPSRSVTRRTILRATGGALAAGATWGAVGAVPGAEDDYDCDETVEIPTVVAGDETVETEEVPKAWHDHNEHVDSVRDAFSEEYPVDEIEWINSVGTTTIEAEVCGRSQFGISVAVADEEYARDELGDAYRGVQLVIEERGPGTNVSETLDDERDESDDPEGSPTSEDSSTNGDDSGEDGELAGFGPIAALTALAGTTFALRRHLDDGTTTDR